VTPHDLRRLALALTAVGLCCVLPIVFGAPIDLLLAAPVLLLVPRGGALIAASLAVRPPPVAATVR
jgi:hypothetical protein